MNNDEMLQKAEEFVKKYSKHLDDANKDFQWRQHDLHKDHADRLNELFHQSQVAALKLLGEAKDEATLRSLRGILRAFLPDEQPT